jgi:PIN domain nuclease of toxin-antitoxin system
MGDGEVRLLLDTHVWVWSQERSGRLGVEAVRLLSDDASEINVATISTVEIARLLSTGDLALSCVLDTWVEQSLLSLVAGTLPLSHTIASRAYSLPGEFHRDPADRILVATALCHGLTFMTADERILAYPHVRSVDARR